MSNRRRRPTGDRDRGDRRSASSASFLLTRMFEWSQEAATVRSFVDKKLSAVPTLVRITSGYNDQSSRFNFEPGSLYLIRSMFSQLLVVARNRENQYLTIPLTSSLKFHLRNDYNEHRASAVDPQTLADMLSNADVTSFEGHRVRLANSQGHASVDKFCDGELQLVSMYNEKFLLGYAFSGATLTGDVKILPGYIPLSMRIARGMNANSKTGSYQQYVSQLMAVTESFQQNQHNITGFLEDITVHKDEPNSDYDSLDGSFLLQLQNQPYYINSKDLSSSMMSSLSSSTPPKSSKDLPVRPVNAPTEARTTPDTYTYQSSSLYQSPSGLRLLARPLPAIPVHHSLTMSSIADRSTINTFPRNESPQFDETLIKTFQTHRKAAAGLTLSLPAMNRTNSDPNLLDDECDSKDGTLTGRARVLSQSFEDLVVEDGSQLFDTAPDQAPAIPPKTVEGETFGGSNSLLRRRRPVARSRKGVNTYKNVQFQQQTHTASYSSTSSVAQDKPGSHTAKRTSYTDLDMNDNIYEQIKSPIYCDMSLSKTLPRSHRLTAVTNVGYQLPQNAVKATVVTSSTYDDSSIYEDFQPRLSTENAYDNDLYANCYAIRNSAINGRCDDVIKDATMPTDDVAKQSASSLCDIRSGVVKPMVRQTASRLDQYVVDDGDYCRPVVPIYSFAKRPQDRHVSTSQRQPIGDQQGAQSTPSQPVDTVDLTTDNDDITWTSLDEVPPDVTSLTVEGVAACLRLLKLSQHVARFRQEQVDGDLLSSLDKDVLMEDFDFKRFDAIKLEKFVREGWRPRLTASTASAAAASAQFGTESFC